MAQWRFMHPAEAGTPQPCLDLRLRRSSNHGGRKLWLLTLIDEFTRECLVIRVARRIDGGVIETMAERFIAAAYDRSRRFAVVPAITRKVRNAPVY